MKSNSISSLMHSFLFMFCYFCCFFILNFERCLFFFSNGCKGGNKEGAGSFKSVSSCCTFIIHTRLLFLCFISHQEFGQINSPSRAPECAIWSISYWRGDKLLPWIRYRKYRVYYIHTHAHIYNYIKTRYLTLFL